MEIKKQTRNELFKRIELIFELESEKNPGFEGVKKIVSEKIKKPEENIDVLHVRGNFGSRIFEAEAYIYDSKEDLAKMIKLRMTKKQKKESADAKKEDVVKSAESE